MFMINWVTLPHPYTCTDPLQNPFYLENHRFLFKKFLFNYDDDDDDDEEEEEENFLLLVEVSCCVNLNFIDVLYLNNSDIATKYAKLFNTPSDIEKNNKFPSSSSSSSFYSYSPYRDLNNNI